MDARLSCFIVVFFSCLVNAQPYTERHGHNVNRGLIFSRRILPQQEECGITEVAASRVVSGEDATLGEWPWQAWTNITDVGFTCGGSLISPEWVLTAGHCIINNDASKYRVTLGDVDRSKHEKSEQTFTIRKIIKHPLYGVEWPYDNDVALLHLSRKAKITPFVKTVCLPKAGQDAPIGTKCFISGWGQMLHPGSVADILQQAEMPIVSNNACAAKLDTSPNGGLHTDNRTWSVTEKMLCAGDAGKTKTNGCYGDSGGPFVCRSTSGRWVLQGVVSWGDPDCSSANHYSVFARISKFATWIQEQIDRYSYY